MPQQGDFLVFQRSPNFASFTFVVKRTAKTVVLSNVQTVKVKCENGWDLISPLNIGVWSSFRKPVKVGPVGEFVESSGIVGTVWDGEPVKVRCSCKPQT